MQWVLPGENPYMKEQDKQGEENNPKKTKVSHYVHAKKPKEGEKFDKISNFIAESQKENKVREEQTKQISSGTDPISPNSSVTTGTFQSKYSDNAIVRGLAKNFEYKVDASKSPKANIYALSGFVTNRWTSTFKPFLQEQISKSTDNQHAKKMKMQALERGHTLHNMSVASFPALAKEAVNSILGEELANRFREDMEEANLSINLTESALEGVRKTGTYIASTAESYLKNQGQYEKLDTLKRFIKAGKEQGLNDEELIQALYDDYVVEEDEIGERYDWMDVHSRASAEYDAIGLGIEDAKPTYVAFNPLNEETGAAPSFGMRWLKVNQDILKDCTLTFADSFADTRSLATVVDMDHLKDIFILKALEAHRSWGNVEEMEPEEKESLYNDWHAYKGNVPLELQYHAPEITKDNFEIVSRALSDYEKTIITKDMDLDGLVEFDEVPNPGISKESGEFSPIEDEEILDELSLDEILEIEMDLMDDDYMSDEEWDDLDDLIVEEEEETR